MSGLRFESGKAAGEILSRWRRGLDENRGSRAGLRRCANLTQVVLEPAFHRLCQDLSALPGITIRRERLPAVVLLVAVAEWQEGEGEQGERPSLPRQMGLPGEGNRSPVSELRFRRLLQCQEQGDLTQEMRRILGVLGQKVDIYGLANAVYHWGDGVRKEWAYAYFGAMPQQEKK
ncbi:MAG: type I-E CRISPR-associated protein Cse2/CasB [Magnetococcales bacterium]|nr:type I-E CRISPR-associated protein Cse2/CasB [Magnetococcales bacterium]